MQLILFDSPAVRTALLPLTYARPVADLRLGSLTIAEKWARQLECPVSYLTQDYLRERYPFQSGQSNLLIDGSLLPTVELLSFVRELPLNTIYYAADELMVAHLDPEQLATYARDETLALPRHELPHLPLLRITRPADLFLHNDRALRDDFDLVTNGRISAALPKSNRLIGPADQLFIEPGVDIESCTLSTRSGLIYIGREAVVLEGGMFRGPLAINAGAIVKMGAKIYGGTTIGDRCKVGGEISNVVFQANSNKGHDGYLGNAVIGEWCNLGAGTDASNLKNDYGEVKVWSYAQRAMQPSGLQFHGLIMGDHCKTGIGTTLNTGTVIGFSSNVFGAGFPPSFVPSFSWGGAGELATYRLEKAVATAERVMARRGETFGSFEEEVFRRVFADSERYR
ncbi:putative sugar nucleotidyl transferase [Neolewinella sp.]|uniref:putative sugar nucleotidyl transferase n=1 Tax=Neolewinella sp. TaxID=2993543 RepID=UPI003B518412